ncbi:hypothetical protein KP509_22G029500 [Ceratopteris richardii]|nr:hypothetical protein KP509_22G029500 [Ceratopteris richardii]
MDMVLSTHSSTERMVSESHHPVSNVDGKSINTLLENSIKLLDTCVVLKTAVGEIKNYCGYLEIALRAVQKDPMSEIQVKRCMKALKKCMEVLNRKDDFVHHFGQRRSKLENCSSTLRRMGEKLNTEVNSIGNYPTAIYAAQVVTIFVCSLLSSAFSLKPKRSFSSVCAGGQSSWSFSLSRLQKQVKEQTDQKKSRGSIALLEELDMADIAVRDFHNLLEKRLHRNPSFEKVAQILKVKESVEVLQALLTDLQHGISTLEFQVESIYRNLLRSRMAFIDMHQGS